ncbi:MAG: right-handed parallel beta-helix repeat-containing protein [Deltaproteobacteria bacterium]|nr:right-handed parallel beta-helix repeat-containing protein [Deltaproteobacteria bacterium]
MNGYAMQQVLSRAALRDKTFFVDEIEHSLYVRTTPETSITAVNIEVSLRSPLLSADGVTNIVLRGLTFQHANTPYHTQTVRFDHSSQILIEDCRFDWNNWGGLHFEQSRNVTVRRSAANHNGAVGMVAGFGKNFLFEENETSYNNWRGASGGFTGWEVAGLKHLFIHDALYRAHRAVANLASGMWFDSGNVNITLVDARIDGNMVDGLYVEANHGPITVHKSIICHNGRWGVLVANSRKVTVEQNILYANAACQLVEHGGRSVRTIEDSETKESVRLTSGDWSVSHNIVVGTSETEKLFCSNQGSSEDSASWAAFRRSLVSEENVWFNPHTPEVFALPGGRQVSLGTWRAALGQDANSLFADPRLVDPAQHQFRLLPESPVPRKEEWETLTDSPAFRVR